MTSRSLKVTKGHRSFQEFEKFLPNTFIYESILNTNINYEYTNIEGHFYVYFSLNLRSYGQLVVLFLFHKKKTKRKVVYKNSVKVIIRSEVNKSQNFSIIQNLCLYNVSNHRIFIKLGP